MGSKKHKKTVVPVYLKPPEEVVKREVEYNAQTQVHDAFDQDLDFLLRHNDEVMDDKIKVDDSEEVDDALSGRRDTRKKNKGGKKPRSQVRQEILKLDFDLGFSSDEDEDEDGDRRLEGEALGEKSKSSEQFMDKQLQLSEKFDDLTLLSSDESISDYFQLKSDSDFEEEPQSVVSDEEEQIQLDEEFNNRGYLSKRFEALNVTDKRDGKKGQKKKKLLFDEVGSNWERLQKKMVKKSQERPKRNKQSQKASQVEGPLQNTEEGSKGKKKRVRSKLKKSEKPEKPEKSENSSPRSQPQSNKSSENKNAKPVVGNNTSKDSTDQSTSKTTKPRVHRRKKHPTALKTTID